MLEQNIPLLTDNLIQQIATNIYEKQKGNSKTEQVDNKNYKYNYLNETSLKTFYNKHQNLTQTNETIRQVAPKTTKKQGLVEEKPKVKNKNSIMTYKNALNPIYENENFYTDFNYIVKKDYFELKGQGKKIKASPEFDNEINKLYKEFDENFTFNKATVTDNVTYKNATKPIAVTLEYTNNKSEQKKTFLYNGYKKTFKGYSFEVSNEVRNGKPIIKVTDNGETVGYVAPFVLDENKIETDHIDQTDDMVKTAEKSEEEKQLKTKKENWKKYFEIKEPTRLRNEYFVYNKNNDSLVATFETQEEAETAVNRFFEIQEKVKERLGNINFVREYKERREQGKNISPDELKETFGFKGVNFGNWVNQKKRQDFINYAYDSLLDLAELLNLPPKAISLNGELGLAFGAQGHGGKIAGHMLMKMTEHIIKTNYMTIFGNLKGKPTYYTTKLKKQKKTTKIQQN